MSDAPDPTASGGQDVFGARRPQARDAVFGSGDGAQSDEDPPPHGRGTTLPRGSGRAAVLVLLVAGSSAWAWQARDVVAYALRASGPPRELGDVRDLTPADLPHNAYVSVHGVTEHRGVSQETVRGLGLVRRPRWTFRLVGGRGIFIETPPDAAHYGVTQAVTAVGRVVDPARDSAYAALLRSYADLFAAEMRPSARVILVGVAPGDGRAGIVLAGAAVSLLVAAQAIALWRQLMRR